MKPLGLVICLSLLGSYLYISSDTKSVRGLISAIEISTFIQACSRGLYGDSSLPGTYWKGRRRNASLLIAHDRQRLKTLQSC